MRILLFILLSITAYGQDYASIAKIAASKTDIQLFEKTEQFASDVIISTKDWNIDGAKYKPGDRLILQGPTRGAIQFTGLKGTKDAPIIITATDKVLINKSTAGARVVQLFNCDYVRFTGGAAKLIEITGGGHGITASNGSNHIEVDNLYIHNVGYSGIDITNYPTCDVSTWRGAAPDMEASAHDNKITDLTDGEAIYIGASHYQGTFDITCNGVLTKALEPGTANVTVYNNIIERIGADGIQVGGAVGGAHIHHNNVTDTGKKKVVNQASGIQANPGSVAIIEDNVVDGCTSFGIIHQGRPTGSFIRRNTVRNTVGALFTVAREAIDQGSFQVYDNKFLAIQPTAAGVGVEVYTNTDFQDNVLEMVKGTQFRAYGAKINTAPRMVTEPGTITVETTGAVSKIYVLTPSGKRIELK